MEDNCITQCVPFLDLLDVRQNFYVMAIDPRYVFSDGNSGDEPIEYRLAITYGPYIVFSVEKGSLYLEVLARNGQVNQIIKAEEMANNLIKDVLAPDGWEQMAIYGLHKIAINQKTHKLWIHKTWIDSHLKHSEEWSDIVRRMGCCLESIPDRDNCLVCADDPRNVKNVIVDRPIMGIISYENLNLVFNN